MAGGCPWSLVLRSRSVRGPWSMVRLPAWTRDCGPGTDDRPRDGPRTQAPRTKDLKLRDRQRLQQPPRAVAELFETHARAIHHRQQQVGHRRVELVLEVAAHLEFAAETAGKQ